MLHLNIFFKYKFKLLFFFLTIVSFNLSAEEKKVIIDTISGKVIFTVEVADTNEERTKGLMFREELNLENGMLFVFPTSRKVNIWMKNTSIPLDIIYISSDNNIFQIEHTALPKNKKIYSSKKPAKFVLEVNAGQAKRNNINIGDRVYIE